VLEAGPPDGPLALLLHGFPDTPWTWRHLMPLLAEDGFRVVAPYLRGYHPSGVPADGRYQTGALVADAMALYDALAADHRAVLVGHDWGAFAAYGAAALAPERWRRVVGMAVPPLPALLGGLTSFAQLKRSWYIWFFQSPLADPTVAADDMAFIANLWNDWSPGYDATFDLEQVRAALPAPANLGAAIGYYRALFDFTSHAEELQAEQAAASSAVPHTTLYLHGTGDGAMGAELIGEHVLSSLGPGSSFEMVEHAGHFLHLEQASEVNSSIRDFLAEP
jgi:pimeloyl-ACP methyl ester carboxylesterase